jgi:hypothetical protein
MGLPACADQSSTHSHVSMPTSHQLIGLRIICTDAMVQHVVLGDSSVGGLLAGKSVGVNVGEVGWRIVFGAATAASGLTVTIGRRVRCS